MQHHFPYKKIKAKDLAFVSSSDLSSMINTKKKEVFVKHQFEIQTRKTSNCSLVMFLVNTHTHTHTQKTEGK